MENTTKGKAMERFADTTTKTSINLVSTTGETLWHSVPVISREKIANGQSVGGSMDEAISNGAKLVEVEYELEAAPCDKVINAAMRRAIDEGFYCEGDENLVRGDMTRFLNMTPDAGRPSDAARSAVRSYLANPTAYRETWQSKRANDGGAF